MFKKLLVIVFVLSLVLAGCGGKPALNKIDVTMTDFKYTPDSATIAAGQTITLNATNNGAVKHEYVIMKHGLDIGADFGPEDEDNIYWEQEVEPGKSVSVTFTAPSDLGDYQIVCGIAGHFTAGMVSKLTVVAAK